MHATGDDGGGNRSRIRHVCAVLGGALLMTWPALYNGYPLLYPDSMSYLGDGGTVARALFRHKFSEEYGRAPFYSLGILPLHWNITPWPIIILHAVLTAYVLWLVARSLLPRRALIAYCGLVVPLCLVTGLGWLVSWIMPDFLGPVLYLSIYLIVFSWEDLRPAERVAVALITGWAVASHASHLILAGGLCLALVLVLVLRREPTRRWLGAVGKVVTIIMAAAAAQLALNAYLYGKPSLNGKRPPFLLARVVADGPGRWYLQRRCGDRPWSICDHVHELPHDAADFLWKPGGIWLSSTVAEQERLREDEMPIVLGTVRAYPREELAASATHFWQQLQTFGLWDYGPNPWTLQMFDTVLPGQRVIYLQTRQSRQTLHEEFFTAVQGWTVIAAFVVIGIGTLLMRRELSPRLIGLAAATAFVLIANAAVTGILSNVEDRYQARVIWLVPLLAGALVMTWLDHRYLAPYYARHLTPGQDERT